MFFFIVYGIGAVASVTVVVTEYTLRLIFSDYFVVYENITTMLIGIEGKGISCLFATLSKESEPFAIPVG